MSVSRLRAWCWRRAFPLLATAGLLVIGMVSTTWWGADVVHMRAWPLPHDLWATMVAARRMSRLNLAGLYTQPTGLISFPGAALILVPVVMLIKAAGLSLAVPGAHNPQPFAWLLAGPYEIVLSAMVLFAADRVAERLGLNKPKRAVLAAAQAATVWSASVRWGHPEDAVAMALFLYAVVALYDGRTWRSAWLAGAAIAVQPLVLLALPVVLAVLPGRRVAGFLAQAAIPPTLLVAAAAAANFSATYSALTRQPNWPSVDHPTPWTSLAPKLSGGAVAAGPGRLIAIGLACGCAILVARRWRSASRVSQWGQDGLLELLWWVALTLALRCFFESVMVAYYLWPALAAALLAALTGWVRLITTGVLAVTLTFVSQDSWPGIWIWWTAMNGGLGLTLLVAMPRLSWRPRGTTREDPASVVVPEARKIGTVGDDHRQDIGQGIGHAQTSEL